jgi:hypothetical protein
VAVSRHPVRHVSQADRVLLSGRSLNALGIEDIRFEAVAREEDEE